MNKKKKEYKFDDLEFPDDDPNDHDINFSDEETSQASDTGTPLSSTLQSTPNSSEFKIPAKTSASAEISDENGAIFKIPSTSTAPDISNAKKSLNFEEDTPKKSTRSKVDLKEVSIVELENAFQPPDITPDMYDNDNIDSGALVDEFEKFLFTNYADQEVKTLFQ